MYPDGNHPRHRKRPPHRKLVDMRILLALVVSISVAKAEWQKTILRSETAEVTIVPGIGRIMQFGFIGKPGIFWNAPELVNKPAVPTRTGWQNFGGEKVSARPENDWQHYSLREGWLPPVGFDATPATLSETTATSATMTWPRDERSGIHMTREISLLESTLTITTNWSRHAAGPSPLAIWTIAQLKDPDLCFLAKGKDGDLPPGLIQLSKTAPPSLRELPFAFSLTRDPATAYKVGSSASDMLWADSETICHIRISPSAGNIQPDAGSRIQIYTNPDAKPYVELENPRLPRPHTRGLLHFGDNHLHPPSPRSGEISRVHRPRAFSGALSSVGEEYPCIPPGNTPQSPRYHVRHPDPPPRPSPANRLPSHPRPTRFQPASPSRESPAWQENHLSYRGERSPRSRHPRLHGEIGIRSHVLDLR